MAGGDLTRKELGWANPKQKLGRDRKQEVGPCLDPKEIGSKPTLTPASLVRTHKQLS